MAKKKEQGEGIVVAPRPVPRLQKKYREEIAPAMQEKFSYGNVMEIPRIKKIVVNMGVGEASRDIKELDAAEKELTVIVGQKPKTTRAKVSVAQFKIREGMPVGCFVTLRGARMYEFLDRLLSVALPRVRDFRGLPGNSFDGRGNYSIGIREHNIFVELEYSQISRNRGMNITMVTNARSDAEAKELLRLFGVPFRN
ncbi:MAG: large subunit ribosomal protein [Candidatus Sumerlaeota bacterium]|nr:large subunit ribosomal protein [Candidatus Sumerlaeota bacterium]